MIQLLKARVFSRAFAFLESNMQKSIQVWKEVADYQSGEIVALRKEIFVCFVENTYHLAIPNSIHGSQ